MNRLLKWLSVTFLGVWILYMGAVALILNTPLFEKLADMNDPALTHVNFQGAFSPYPGYLWADHAKVFISDQNVSVSIYLDSTSIHFELKPILNKIIRVDDLKVRSAWVDLGMKTPAETIAHISKHTELKDVNLDVKIARGKEALKNHIKLEFPHLSIDHLTPIVTSLGKFEGDLNLQGGFRIQPGAEVEVYPTDLIIKDGNLPDQFTGIHGKVHVQFDPFFIPDAPGNAVFQFVNAKLNLQGVVQSLGFLNLTLRKLPNYQVSQGKTNVTLNLDVDHGNLLAGSGMQTDPSHVVLQNTDIRATGNGQITWKVLPKDKSELSANLRSIQVQQIKDNSHQGTLSQLDLTLMLYGNSLIDAFHGVASDLRLKDLHWDLATPAPKKGKVRNISYQGTVEGSGRILGLSGVVPKSVEKFWKAQSTHLDLVLKPFKMTTSFLPPTTVTGTLAVLAKPIDFSVSTLVIPEIKTNLDITVEGHGSSKAEGRISSINYLLAPYHQWKGHLDLKIADTGPFIKAMRDADKMSAILGTFANVSNLTNNVDWEMGDEYSWFRFNEINSTGIWKGYGSLMNNEDGLLGAFELKVASVPIGIRITPDKTDVKILPSKEWYNELVVKQPSLTAQAKP